jgi:hypothetical protein
MNLMTACWQFKQLLTKCLFFVTFEEKFKLFWLNIGRKKKLVSQLFLSLIASILRRYLQPVHWLQFERSFQLGYAYIFLHDAQIFP